MYKLIEKIETFKNTFEVQESSWLGEILKIFQQIGNQYQVVMENANQNQKRYDFAIEELTFIKNQLLQQQQQQQQQQQKTPSQPTTTTTTNNNNKNNNVVTTNNKK
ncbi:hypothetical protein PPL_05182 [Heterostelium album PN500]|uniref:Uncharacterized protein n=1 Tax=Heterostelium pallidum (strain ATCC 26659 / Pp 5 / PN500) TaxID=670386 RepID=D3B9N6_HETP5|nr:hypothetical protein PPL_05182 [Heterostelium album PN500]EFA81948.1 hypothetical protein PPL_05182 [Heterostelium album PN500]|eukprot:XP_020434065.1 hypothetical protein PPL_05182 [Heterostelium album PN500]